jgi:predicted nucleic acid-binding protein
VIHLDTSFLIRALVPGSPEDSRLRAWLGAGETVCMSAIAWAEFLCGPIEAAVEELATEVIAHRRAFSEHHASKAARLFNESGRRRGTLIDCMIAATALEDGAAIATANAADFRRFESAGLVISDGSQAGE